MRSLQLVREKEGFDFVLEVLEELRDYTHGQFLLLSLILRSERQDWSRFDAGRARVELATLVAPTTSEDELRRIQAKRLSFFGVLPALEYFRRFLRGMTRQPDPRTQLVLEDALTILLTA